MLIDIHHHYIPQRFIDLVRDDPERWQAVVYRDEATGLDALVTGRTQPLNWTGPRRLPAAIDPGIVDLALRLEEMDAMGLDMAALSVMPGLFYYFADPELGAEASAVLNDAISEACRAHPDRLVPMGNVPLQDVELAVAELERVVKDYGFTAVEIGASVSGRNYDEPEFDPFFQRAAELDVLIFVHPSSPPGPERMRRYYTQNIIGFPVETAICAAALIFGGVFARYPNIKVCLAHGGGVTSSLVGRWDHGWEARAEASQAIDRPPSEYLKLLYFDDLVHSDQVRTMWWWGRTTRSTWGTGRPSIRWRGRRVEPSDRLGGVSDSEHDLIASETAARLLRLDA